jgi:hypothetical protein
VPACLPACLPECLPAWRSAPGPGRPRACLLCCPLLRRPQGSERTQRAADACPAPRPAATRAQVGDSKAGFFAIASAPDANNQGVLEFLIKKQGDPAELLCAAAAGEREPAPHHALHAAAASVPLRSPPRLAPVPCCCRVGWGVGGGGGSGGGRCTALLQGWLLRLASR